MTATLVRALAAATAAIVVLALSGCGQTGQEQAAPPLIVDVAAGPATGATAPPAATSMSPAAVTGLARLSIAKIAASSTLVPLGLNPDKTVEVPPVSQPEQAGVYAKGPAPGDRGPAVILGHVNGGGRPGVFARLSELNPGDEIDVDRPDGRTAVFRVDRTETIVKDAFPTARVYSDTSGPELRLITCGGDLDAAAHSYRSNVIVFASLLTTRPATPR